MRPPRDPRPTCVGVGGGGLGGKVCWWGWVSVGSVKEMVGEVWDVGVEVVDVG